MTGTEKVQKLFNNPEKQALIEEFDSSIRTLTRLVSVSKESPEVKTKLARLLVFMLNVLDIENERLNFDAIRKAKKGSLA